METVLSTVTMMEMDDDLWQQVFGIDSVTLGDER